ncbi:hypothetical protein BD414DRAFT_255380 [Trametes punicea]|nr:hypothetical protein BD414DRAFT_255380 [Trametes punicea]
MTSVSCPTLDATFSSRRLSRSGRVTAAISSPTGIINLNCERDQDRLLSSAGPTIGRKDSEQASARLTEGLDHPMMSASPAMPR